MMLATDGEICEPCTPRAGFQSKQAVLHEANPAAPVTKPYRADQNAFAADRSAEAPRHAQASRADSSQPLSSQVFDPEHTEYWTPGMEQAGAQDAAKKAYPDAPAPGVPAKAQSNVNASALEQDPLQPNVSQAYMYDSEIAKKRKLPILSVLNFFLMLLFLWMLAGVLSRMDILPDWNLGYAWFNLNIFPLF